MKRIVAIIAVTLMAGVAAAQTGSSGSSTGSSGSSTGSMDDSTKSGGSAMGSSTSGTANATEQLKLPTDAKLVGIEEVDQIRAFPELNNGKTQSGTVKTSNSGTTPPAAKIEGVRAVDAVYTTSRPFKETVSFLDKQLDSPDLQPVVKTSTPSAVGYAVTLPTGKVAHLVVRNTKPTQIETVEAVAAAGEVPLKGGKEMNNGQMQQPGQQPGMMQRQPGHTQQPMDNGNPAVPQ